MRRILVLALTNALCLSFFGSMNVARAQSVMLPIENIPQETQVWCWVAVSQQIVFSLQDKSYSPYGPSNMPAQCQMVERATGYGPYTCCNDLGRYNGNPYCHITGYLPWIQQLIVDYGGVWSKLAPPTSAQALFATLNAGRAIILEVRNSPYTNMSHVVVLRGMSYVDGGWVLHINDPMQWTEFSQPMPYQRLIQFWANAIVIG